MHKITLSFLLVKIQFNYNTPHYVIQKNAIPILGYPRNALGSINYHLILQGVLNNQTKTWMDNNTHIEVLCKTKCLYLFWPTLSKGYHSWPKRWNEVALPSQGILKMPWG